MKSTFKLLFFLKRNGQKANGKMPIIARITLNGKQSEFNTKLDLIPTLWSIELGKASGRSAEAQEVNHKLDEIKSRAFQIYHELMQRDSYVSAEKVRNDLLGISERHETLLVLFERQNQEVKKQIGISKTYATFQKYEVTRKHLERFIKQQYNLSDIPLKEINPLFINDFEVYLKTIGKCNANTTAKFMQFLKRIIIISKNNGWISANPFANYKIVLNKVHRDYLSDEEIQRLMKKEFATKRLEQVRDIFVFSCFTNLEDKKQRKANQCNELIVRNERPLLALSA